MRRIRLIPLLLLSLSQFASADLITPYSTNDHYQQRFDETQIVDETDQWCQGKNKDEACIMPLTAFEDGGNGLCRRMKNDLRETIQLTCVTEPRLELNQTVTPEFDVSPETCPGLEDIKSPREQGLPLSCKWRKQRATDQSCLKKAAGAACTVTGTQGKLAVKFDGFCYNSDKIYKYYAAGRQQYTRKEFVCFPGSLISHEYTPVGTLNKIQQFFKPE